MPKLIKKPTRITSVGDKPRVIEEYIGRVNSETGPVSIARMVNPGGWKDFGLIPEFDEYTVVLKGVLRVETTSETINIRAGQALIAHRGEWVRYSTPEPEGAEYIAVCLPAYSPLLVQRNDR